MRVTVDEPDRFFREHVSKVARYRDRFFVRTAYDLVTPGTSWRRWWLAASNDYITAIVARGTLSERILPRQRYRPLLVHVDEVARSRQVAKELIEASVGWVVLIVESQVPLPHQPGDVAGTLQIIGYGPLGGEQTHIGDVVRLPGVVLESEALLVASGHERCSGWRADRCGDVPLVEYRTLGADTIDVRSWNPTSVGRDVGVTEIIG